MFSVSADLTNNAVQQALAGRYQFVLHGGSTARAPRPRSCSRSQRSANGREPYAVQEPNEFNLNEFARPESLHAAFRILQTEGGPAPGEDGLTYDHFSPSAVFAALRQVVRSLRSRRYLPYPTREVLVPKSNNRWRELHLLCVIDRTVAKALQLALKDYWRSLLPGIGRSVWHIYAKMQQVIREHQVYFLAIDDVRDCFPSAPIDAVLDCHRQHISQPDLFWLIETVVRGYEGPGHLIGLDQGSPYSPIALELLLHTRHDARLGAVFHGLPWLLRYVDNLTFVCSNEREGQQALQVSEGFLSEIGLSLKHEDGYPWDLRDYRECQNVLGLIPKWDNGHLEFSIPEPAFGNLDKGLSLALQARKPTSTAKAVVKGWIHAVGPALTGKAVPEVVNRVIGIARDYGFVELCPRKLSQTAKKARNNWLTFCKEYGRTPS